MHDDDYPEWVQHIHDAVIWEDEDRPMRSKVTDEFLDGWETADDAVRHSNNVIVIQELFRAKDDWAAGYIERVALYKAKGV